LKSIVNKIAHLVCSGHTRCILNDIENQEIHWERMLKNKLRGARVEDMDHTQHRPRDLIDVIEKGHFNFIDMFFIKLYLREKYKKATRNAIYDLI
tara:strand:- start:528 stop:812 length:285 start_codon:yes stop_codon:yes gene_type:complete